MITFTASATDLRNAAALAAVAAGILAALEWRRPMRRNRGLRVLASVFAVAALAMLGLHPAWHGASKKAGAGNGITAALWTVGSASPDGGQDADYRYKIALPGAAAPAGATLFPDAGTLRRRYPELGLLHVFGDGLDAGGLDALTGLRLVFHPPATPAPEGPEIQFLYCPRTLAMGEALVVEGQVGGLARGAGVTITLEGPDGAVAETAATPPDMAGVADFTLRANPVAARGRFLWHLRLAPSSKPDRTTDAGTLGVSIVPPTLPRVLVLESSPHFDTADLRRWFERAGGTFISRTQVGQDRYRFASSSGNAGPEFGGVDGHLLAGFDLVLADPSSIAALTGAERDALLSAVTGSGLGLLTLADEASPPSSASGPLFPWQLTAEGVAAQEEGEHLERPVWTGQARPILTAIPAAPVVLGLMKGQTELVRDGQGRVLAAAVACGRGQSGVTLLRDSGRWLRTNDPDAFSAYWSFLFSRMARPLDKETGRWKLADGDAGPVFAGQPLPLIWTGPASAEPSAIVTAQSGTREDNATLSLGRDPAESGRWRGTFWPRRAGWYEIGAPSGGSEAALDFLVDAAGSWPAITAQRNRLATARFAEASASAPRAALAPVETKGNAAVPAALLFCVFVLSAGFLWTERRLVGAGS
jgi:hypothetical protein